MQLLLKSFTKPSESKALVEHLKIVEPKDKSAIDGH